MPQTSYAVPAVGREGQRADVGLAQIDSYVVESTTVKAGLLAEKGTGDRQIKSLSATAITDVDGIKASGVSSTAAKTYTGAALSGATGTGRIVPAAAITFTFSNHTNWDATTGWITGIDAAGNSIEEPFSIPNGGNATVTTRRCYHRVQKVEIPAQSGASGTFTIGITSALMEVGPLTHPGVVIYEPMVEAGDSSGEFDTYAEVSVLRKGRFYAVPEDAVVPGEEVYVRHLLNSTDLRGQFAGSAGAATAATYAKVLGAKWQSTASADGIAVLEIDFT